MSTFGKVPGAALLIGFGLMAGVDPAQAANVNLLEGAGCPAGQHVCFQPDANFEVSPFTQTGYNAATDTVTGTGIYRAATGATGASTVYVLDADGVTISDIVTATFTNTGVSGGFRREQVVLTWQSDGGSENVNLGPLPAGARTIVEDGSSQDISSLLFSGGPSNLSVFVRSEVDTIATPEPASLAILSLGLGALGLIRHRQRA